MYKIKCQQCGCEFEHYYYNKRFCDDCVKQRKKEYNQKLANERKEKPPIQKKPNKTLSQVIAELETYNREHKTNLKYDEFVKMKGW